MKDKNSIARQLHIYFLVHVFVNREILETCLQKSWNGAFFIYLCFHHLLSIAQWPGSISTGKNVMCAGILFDIMLCYWTTFFLYKVDNNFLCLPVVLKNGFAGSTLNVPIHNLRLWPWFWKSYYYENRFLLQWKEMRHKRVADSKQRTTKRSNGHLKTKRRMESRSVKWKNLTNGVEIGEVGGL